jgi:predicted RNA-binding Zn ribbon-like protein
MTGAAQLIDQPGHRAPAPGGLRLVQAFLNTADIEGGTDEFASPSGVGAWLEGRGLLAPGTEVSERDLRQAVAVREALRDVIEARDTGHDAHAAVAVLERTARRAPLIVRLSEGWDPVLEPRATGIEGAIARILAEASRAAAEGTWRRLKICRNDVCRWSFYDASRNRSGVWCAMAICGNRVKGRAFRARRRRSSRPRAHAGMTS